MKNLWFAVAVLCLSSCGYHKDGASWAESYNDYVDCNKQAAAEERSLENQCMAKRGYQDTLAIPAKPQK